MGTASHVNRRSLVCLVACIRVWVCVSACMPASELCSLHSMQTFFGCNSRIVRFRTGV